MGLYIILDGEPSATYPFCLTQRPNIPTTKQEVEKMTLPQRDGSLTIKRGYLDRDITLEFNILEDRNIKQDIRYFKDYLLGKRTLQFSDDDVYYRINNVEVDDFQNEIEEYGIGTVKMDLEPFEYAVTSPIFLYEHERLINIGTHDALPKITIYGIGDIKIMCNNQSVEFIGITDYITIDSELLLAYRKNNEKMDYKMIGEFPIFSGKYVDISWTGNVEYLEIEPRWRYK